MLESSVTVVNRLGLHARAAARLVQLANTFKSSVTLVREDNSAVADASSILSILTISASAGTRLTVRADGPDDELALHAIEELFAEKFGEE